MQMKHDGLVEFSNNLGSVEYLAGSMMEQLITFVEINVYFSIDDDYVGCGGWEAWLKLLCWYWSCGGCIWFPY